MTIEIPIGWILTAFGTMAAVVATLFRLLWSLMRTRIDTQDEIIAGLRADVERLSRGCGLQACQWRNR